MAQVAYLSFAGIALPLETPEHTAWLERVHPQSNWKDWSGWNFSGSAEQMDPLPLPDWPQYPGFKWNTLYWPTGAARPAWFHAVVTTAILNQIRAAIGTSQQALPLVMFDSRTGKTITAQMFMLPARPLNQLGIDSSDAWVLTLTDVRFYWQWMRGQLQDNSSWQNLINDIGTALGTTIFIDTINPSYQTPSIKWLTQYQPLATELDAICYQIGQRVVVGLDGSVSTANWATAQGASDAYFEFADPVMSGGFLSQNDIGLYVPSSVDVIFAQVASGNLNCYTGPYPVAEQLADLPVASDFSPSTGYAPAAGIAYADIPQVAGVNDAAVANYASATANDWYGWRKPDADIVFPGIEPYVPTGWEDTIEWTLTIKGDKPFASTLIRRGVFDQFLCGDWYCGLTSCSSCCNVLSQGVVTNVCPIFTSGIMTGIIVQTTYSNGDVICVTNPADCCSPPPAPPPSPIPGPVSSACIQAACAQFGQSSVPSTLYVSFSGFTDLAGYSGIYSSLNNTILVLPLVTSSTTTNPLPPSCNAWSPALWNGPAGLQPPYAVQFTFFTPPLPPPSPPPYCSSTACAGSPQCGPSLISNMCHAPGGAGATGAVFTPYVICIGPGENCTTATTFIFGFVSGGGLALVSGTQTLTSCDPFCLTITNAVVQAGGLPPSNAGTIVVSSSPGGACGNPPITYNCSSTGVCTEVYDGSGQYASQAVCQAACSSGLFSYNCVAGSCVQVGGTGGTYSTEAACALACGGGNSGCSSYPSTATGSTSSVSGSCAGCTIPSTINFTIGPLNLYSANVCGGMIFHFSPTGGWKMVGTAFTGTLVMGSCSGNVLDVVFNVTYSVPGCTITFVLTITSP